MFKNINIFEARKEGYKTYRVPGITVTKNDVVLVTAEARPNEGSDWDSNDVILRRSLDAGETFRNRQVVADHSDFGKGPISNFVLIPDLTTGKIIAVFCWKYSRVFRMFSENDGETFSEPEEITSTFEQFHKDYNWRVCATGPGHGIQLQSGRMIIPVWLSDGTGNEMGEGNLGHRPSVVSSIHSDDCGISWERGEIICRHGDDINGETLINPSETIAVQQNNGTILFNIRSESLIDRRLIAHSPDGATNWNIQGFDDALLEPVCMASILKSNYNNEQNLKEILFVNPDNLENDLIPTGRNLRHDRKRLTVKVSNDDCISWPLQKIIEAGPSGYSDIAQLSTGEFLCVYECGIVERICDDKYIRVTKFDRDWISS